MSGALVIDAPGLSSTLQDAGRTGWQRFGISGSGAMDRFAMRIANALVGNPPDAAVVEMTLTGLAATAVGPCRVAVAGADMPVTVNGRRFDGWRSFALKDGDRIAVGAAGAGVYACLAVAGGFAIAPTLGSLSTHTRSNLGGLDGRALRTGDRLPLAGAPDGPDLVLRAADRPGTGGPVRVVLGPQADRFTAEGIATFLGETYRVSGRADRMGVQLDGPAIGHADGFNIVSDGIVNGSVQVPGTGCPLVLLADRQTTGGYPKIATVIGPDIRRIAQRRPGEAVRFQALSPSEAAEAARAAARDLARAVGRIGRIAMNPEDLASADLLALNLIDGACSALD